MDIEIAAAIDFDTAEQDVLSYLEDHGRGNLKGMMRGRTFRAYCDAAPAQVHDAINELQEYSLVTREGGDIVLDETAHDVYREITDHTDTYRDLVAAAIETQDHSWSPYSEYQVGAAVLTTDGDVITGTNVENASYGVTNCAERSAIFSAVSDGQIDPADDTYIQTIVAASPGDGSGSPCGPCRQAIYEFSDPDDPAYVIQANENGKAEMTRIDDLLPGAFGPHDLDIL